MGHHTSSVLKVTKESESNKCYTIGTYLAEKKCHKITWFILELLKSLTILLCLTFQTSDYGLRENVDSHPNRFQLYKRKEILTFQAETMEEKAVWVQDIWDLFFSHMLSLKGNSVACTGDLKSIVQVKCACAQTWRVQTIEDLPSKLFHPEFVVTNHRRSVEPP